MGGGPINGLTKKLVIESLRKNHPISGVPRHKGLIAGLIKGNQWLIRV